MATLAAQSQIGGYELIRLLGEGGMGEVWLAQDKRADRPVALKFIKPHLLDDPGFRTRFTNEAKTLGKLEHDRIVTLYAVLDEGDYLALVLRFIDGRSLADRIDQQGILPMSFVMSCARDILPALDFAHENGIIHRDIKPPNILVDGRDRCFLMDFGIAVAGFAERGTMTGFAIGTPHYMSPEQIRTPREITVQAQGHRSDIYSFGVVLFEMLSGRVPFGQDSGAEDIYTIQHAHCNEPPPPLHEINPDVPPAVEAVVTSCLAKDPADRPQTCMQLLAQLESAALSGGPKARAHMPTVVERYKAADPKPIAPLPVVTAAPRRKIPQQAWYGVGALFIAGGIGYTVWTSETKHNAPVNPTPIVNKSDTSGNNPPPANTKSNQLLTKQKEIPANRPPIIEKPTPQPNEPPPPTEQQLMAAQRVSRAERTFEAGQVLFDRGDYCKSKEKLDEAVSLNPKPEYIKLRQSAANGCDSQ